MIFAVALSSLIQVSTLHAHEVQPGVIDIEFQSGDIVSMSVEWIIEAPVAGIDLENLEDTNASDLEEEYMRLRALPSTEMKSAFLSAWPNLREKLYIRVGGSSLVPELRKISIPGVGNVDLPRTSVLHLVVELPKGDTPLTIGWSKDLGPLIVRQRVVEDGYAGFLTPGQVTDPIPRVGSTEQEAFDAFKDYTLIGFDHIVPQGLDHIFFVLGLFFLSLKLRPLLWQVSAFTLAHTVTLALGTLHFVTIPASIVEPLIAASIVYVGVENLLMRDLPRWRPLVVFCFGLLHGLGFASVLQDFGLGADHFTLKLIGFNLGVELGQLAVITAAFLAFALTFGHYKWYHRRIAAPVSAAIAVIAAFWVLERTGIVAKNGTFGLFSTLTEGGFATTPVLISVASLALCQTLLVLFICRVDWLRDAVGVTTSFMSFFALVATFTSGAWIVSITITAIWVLALRLQCLSLHSLENHS